MEVNRIYCESNMGTMARMPDGFIDLTITSPPYNLGKSHHTNKNRFEAYDIYNDAMPEQEYQALQVQTLTELHRVTSPNGSCFYNHKNRIRDGLQISPYEWLTKTPWLIKQEIVWCNGTPNMDNIRFYPMTERVYWLSKNVETGFVNKGSWLDFISIQGEGTDGQHKRSFPLRLASMFIAGFDNANMIFDPYMGSGTVAVASHKLKRNWIGSEISAEYVKLANDRLEPYLAQSSLF